MQSGSSRSYTAEGVTALRAVGARERDPKLRNPDHLAEQFLTWPLRTRVRWAPLRVASVAVIERLLPGLYRFVTARTKHIDSVLVDELGSGAVRQLFILGAGADSRPYRFRERLDGVRVFELDHPATSAWKQQQTRKLFGQLPAHVRYVPINFDSQPLATALDEAGADRNTPSLFIWEGVTPYLTEQAVTATLREISRFATGSSVLFDYFYHDAIHDPTRHVDAPKFHSYLGRRGEPLTFGIEPDQMAAYLATHGLTLASHAYPADLADRHLGGAHQVLPFSAIVHARTAG
ncbi:class I SAM-dependent methyltransferase [Micromonospora sonneratiae]|uniref:S-adenosyl-L-methionine-dependent methyltransferase n=1 Tax=Micromonospora sonneratiae TaxID=1184706 RepID=A0ABW3YG00_9ACTN